MLVVLEVDRWFNFHSCFTTVKCYMRTVGIKYMRKYPDKFLESNTENYWMEYITDK